MSTMNTSPPQLTPTQPRREGWTVRPWHAVHAAAAMTGFLVSVVASNIVSVHWPPIVIAGLVVPAGTVFAGTSLTARDLVHGTLGAYGVAVGIVAGAGLSAVFASPQMAAAGVVAFTTSEIVDALIYTRLRHRSLLGAVAVSNAGGLVVDSVLFVPLAFGGFTAVPGQIVGKALATVLTLAALQIATVFARRAVTRT
ncbi:VUT family protein [Actinophytocola sp. NPDC049390]|uniref:VUT family protein n=1 Tax=Actinophytocola sp. NPDC049390 TaxID=3363894 RepID=UPI00378FD55B